MNKDKTMAFPTEKPNKTNAKANPNKAGKVTSFPPVHSGNSPFNVEELRQANVMGNKIAEERRRAGMNQKQLAEALRAYNIFITPPAISKWEKGESIPSSYQLIALSMIFGITDVIPTFTGLKPVAAEYTPELSQKGINLLKTIKDALIASGQFEPGRHSPAVELEEMEDVKAYDQRAAAGNGCIVDEASYSIKSFPSSTVPYGTDFVIYVSGNSMLPRYVNNQPLMIHQQEEVEPGQIGVFMYDGNSYVKQYTEIAPDEGEVEDYTDCDGFVHPKVVLHSLNPDYDDIEIKPGPPFYVVGRVLN